MICVETP